MYLESEKWKRWNMGPLFAHRREHGDFYHIVKELELYDGEGVMQ